MWFSICSVYCICILFCKRNKGVFFILSVSLAVEKEGDENEIPALIEKSPIIKTDLQPSTSASSKIITGRKSLSKFRKRKRLASKLSNSKPEPTIDSLNKVVLELEAKKLKLEMHKLTNENYMVGLQATKLELEIGTMWKNAGMAQGDYATQVLPFVKDWVFQQYRMPSSPQHADANCTTPEQVCPANV